MSLRRYFRKFLAARGYELLPLDRFGARALTDIQHLYGGFPLKTIFDVGAHTGQTARRYSAAYPQATIYSFEPSAESFEKLSEAAADCSRIKPIRSALGECSGEQTLFLNSVSQTNSLLPNAPEAERFYTRPDQATNIGRTTVAVTTIDDYCTRENIAFIDLFKTDTQGYEMQVLRGGERMLAAGKVAVIFIEVAFVSLYSGQSWFHEIYEHLWARCFRLVNLYGTGLNKENYISWCNALFVQPDSLALRTNR